MIKKIVLFFASFIILAIGPVLAANFTIDNYAVDIVVNEDKTMNITEVIDTNFTSHQHGIYRDIPLSGTLKRTNANNHSYSAAITEVEVNEKYTKSFVKNFLRLKIGSPNYTIIGKKRYVIKYKYNMGKDLVNGADELYFNIIGDGWTTIIKKVEYSIHMPKEFNENNIFFYLPTDKKSNYYTVKNNTIKGKYYSRLYPGNALTIKINLPDKYFIEPPITFNVHMFLFIIPLVLLIFSAVLWYIYGRDNKTIEVVGYKPPEDMNPVEMAYIYSQNVTPDDISSLIFYLASKGYIKISTDANYNPDSIFANFSMNNIKFNLVKEYDGSNPIESILIEAMFAGASSTSVYKMASNHLLKLLPSEILKELKKSSILFVNSSLFCQRIVYALMLITYILCCFLFTMFINLPFIVFHLIIFPLIGYFILIKPILKHIILGKCFNPFIFIFGFIWCSFSIFMLSIVSISQAKTSGVPLTFLYFAIGIILIILTEIFATHMPKWTYKGNSVYGQILGFRSFLKRVKLREMKYRINKDPQYFYDILPFAFVLGLSDKWIEKFMPLMSIAPAYYNTNDFNPRRYTSTIRNIKTLTSSCFVSQSSGSGGSSCGGGGSSGGGGGGGGGGSW